MTQYVQDTSIRIQTLLFTGALTLSCWSANVAARNFDLRVSDEGLISITANQVPVEEVVNAIGEEMGIKISFPSPVPEMVTVDFEELKLEQAIKQLTQSYIFVTSKSSDPKKVREIIVMPEGETSSYLPEEGNIEEQVRMANEAAGAGDQNLEGQQLEQNEMAIQMDQLQRKLSEEVPYEEELVQEMDAPMEEPQPIPESVEPPEFTQ